MASKRKYIRLTLEAYEQQVKQRESYYYELGLKEGRKQVCDTQSIQRLEAVTKVVNAIGQTQDTFARMLHEDGVLSQLLKR